MLASTIVTEVFGNILSLQRTMVRLGGGSRGTVDICGSKDFKNLSGIQEK